MTRHIVVFGASGGIGGAISAHYDMQPECQVTPISRASHGLDLRDEASIAAVADQFQDETISEVIVATGHLHNDNYQPEKTVKQLSMDACAYSFAINTIGPMLVAKHFIPKLHHDQRAVIALLSARVGSISDNRLGGWYSYRASKAALNMMITCMGIELKRTHKQLCCVGVHPGTVDTALSAPFQRQISTLFSPTEAAAKLALVLDNVTVADSGYCLDWKGDRIEP